MRTRRYESGRGSMSVPHPSTGLLGRAGSPDPDPGPKPNPEPLPRPPNPQPDPPPGPNPPRPIPKLTTRASNFA